MTASLVFFYVTDTLADWEVGHAIAHISKPSWQRAPGRYRVVTVAESEGPVTTMGGVRIAADLTLSDVELDAAAMLILPGADTWADPEAHAPLLDIARRFIEAGTPVAAICGATYGLARAGLLDGRRHTSNARIYLESSGYGGGDGYVEQPAVTDRGVTTASGCHPVAFAAEIFRVLDLYEPRVLEAWQGLYTTGEERHFAVLAAA